MNWCNYSDFKDHKIFFEHHDREDSFEGNIYNYPAYCSENSLMALAWKGSKHRIWRSGGIFVSNQKINDAAFFPFAVTLC